MDFDYSPDQLQFKNELREFLIAEVPEDKQAVFGLATEAQYRFGREINLKLAARRWLAVGFPEEYGGDGKSLIEQGILAEELGYRLVPEAGTVGLNVVFPSIMAFGSSEQKETYLSPIAKSQVEYCQAFSEPNIGSDRALSGLRAERDVGDYVLNGTQTFTGNAFHADYMFLLASTESHPEKNWGVSLFVIDTKTPGINLQPNPLINGEMSTHTSFDNVRTPGSCLIGVENRGREYTITNPHNAISELGRYGAVRRVFDDFTDFCNDSAPDGGQPLAEHPLVRHQLAQRRLGMETWKLLSWQGVSIEGHLSGNGTEVAWACLFGSQERLRFAEMAMEVLGPYATLRNGSHLVPLLGNIEGIHRETLNRQSSGTADIQRDNIAQMGLGMPRLGY